MCVCVLLVTKPALGEVGGESVFDWIPLPSCHTEVPVYSSQRVLALLTGQWKGSLFHLLLFQKLQKQQALLSLHLGAEKYCSVEAPQEGDSKNFMLHVSPEFLTTSEQIQTHAFIFLCLIWRTILHLDSVARGQVAVWHLVEMYSETLELQQRMLPHHRWKHGVPGSPRVIDWLGCHVHFCSISLTEYHPGSTDFNETGSRSKNNTCHPEIIKTRRPDVRDIPSFPKEQKQFFFFAVGKTPPISVNLFTKLLSLAWQKTEIDIEVIRDIKSTYRM